MKIAVVFSYLAEPQYERLTYERSIRERYISRRLVQDGHDVLLCYLTNELQSFKIVDNLITANFFPIDQLNGSDVSYYTSKALGHALSQFNPDKVLIKGMGYKLPYWLYKKGFLSCELIFIAGGNPVDIMLPYASYVFGEFQSQLRNEYRRLARHNRAAMLGKYIPEEDFGVDNDKKYDIVTVGSITDIKNHKALAPLFGKYSICVIGNGPELPALKKLAEGKKGVIFTGGVKKNEVASYIKQSRLMVHPSHSDGFPRAFAEAFAVGVPVVALKKAILGDFPDGHFGLLVREEELIEVVDNLLNDEKRLKSYSANAYRYAVNAFSGDVIYNQILNGIDMAKKTPGGIDAWFLKAIFFPTRYWIWLIRFKLFKIVRKLKRALLLKLKGV